jgi:GAF domain-containing protein
MRLIASSRDVGDVCAAIAQAAVDLLDARVARVWLNDATAGTLTVGGSFGVDADTTRGLLDVAELAHGQGMPGDVMRHGTPLYLEDASHDPRWVNARFITTVGVGGYAGLPLVAGHEIRGVLSVMFAGVRTFTEEDTATLELLADQAAIALRQAQTFAGPGVLPHSRHCWGRPGPRSAATIFGVGR